MAANTGTDDRICYDLLDRVTDLLICSRCFRRNVRQPARQVLSRRHRPLPLCAECSGEIKPGHSAKILRFG